MLAIKTVCSRQASLRDLSRTIKIVRDSVPFWILLFKQYLNGKSPEVFCATLSEAVCFEKSSRLQPEKSENSVAVCSSDDWKEEVDEEQFI